MLTERNLAPTTFFGGPAEELATADVYEIQSDTVINKLPMPASFSSITADELRGGPSMLSKLPMLTDIKVAGGALKGNPLSTMKGSFGAGGFLGALKNTGTTIYKALGGVSGIKALSQLNTTSVVQRLSTGGLNGIPGLANMANLAGVGNLLGNGKVPPVMGAMLNAPVASRLGAFATTNGITSRLSPNNLGQSFQMGNLISGLVPGAQGTTNIVDKDMTSRLISAIAVGGMSSGVQGAFSAALPLANGDNAIISNAGRVALSYAASTGNIKGFKDVVNAVGAKNLVSMGSTAIKSLADNFSFGASQTDKPASGIFESFSETKSAFDKLDDKWLAKDVMKINLDTSLPEVNYTVVDISTAREGSGDFQTMMQLGAKASTDNNLKYFALANAFPQITPEAELAKVFPLTKVQATTRTSSQVTENRAVEKNSSNSTAAQRGYQTTREFEANKANGYMAKLMIFDDEQELAYLATIKRSGAKGKG
jgi:hypothetical protein